MVYSNLTNNVLDRISGSIISNKSSSFKENCLVVFNGSNLDISKSLNFIEKLKDKYDISLGFSFMAERLIDTSRIIDFIKPTRIYKEEDIANLKSIVEEHSILVAPNITVNTLSKVSTGMIDSFVSNLIWSYLYMGKPVYVSFNSVKHYMGVKSKSVEMTKIIEGHIDKVLKMGAIEIENKKTVKAEVKSDTSQDKKLITEKDILNMDNAQKVLVLNKGTLITPLAKDKARELGIRIEIR